MKAFLLAAGLGTRLRPLTNTLPKCLVPINGVPLLGWWIRLMEQHGVTEVMINLYHLPDQVITYLESAGTSIRFHYFREPKLLGSGGTLRENKGFIAGEKEFFILYADNLTNYNLSAMLSFHRQKRLPFTMALFRTHNPRACGIATLNEQKTIIEFVEKPEHPVSDLANAGLYIATPEVLSLIPNHELTDIGFHLLPQLVNRMAGWETEDYLTDVGTFETLAKAEREWPAHSGLLLK